MCLEESSSWRLQVQYQADHEFSRWIRMIPTLAFVPTNNVVAAFEDLVEHTFSAEAESMSSYFDEATYIGRRQRCGRRVSIFPLQVWNASGSAANEQKHRRLESKLPAKLWHALPLLTSTGSLNGWEGKPCTINYGAVQLIAADHQIAARNNKCAAISKRIKRLRLILTILAILNLYKVLPATSNSSQLLRLSFESRQ